MKVRNFAIAICSAVLAVYPAAGQNPAPGGYPNGQGTQSSAPLLTPSQLDSLVAPVALYPDPLLGQVLAASTYPLEIIEASQWLSQNGNLQGADLTNAAKQQNWDPSVQALVAFPDAMSLLSRNVRWTTDLGNAFLAQQADVQAAVQRMRVRAQANGRLASTPQQTVSTQTQNGQSAVVIEPPSPEVIYVPVYDPAYVWGAGVWGYYPPLWYPSYAYGYYGWGPRVYLGGFFPGWGIGWGGWGLGWGWGWNWFGGGLFVNSFFFNHYGFHGYYGGGVLAAGRFGWEHDAFHRAGVSYANAGVAARFNNERYAAGRAMGARTAPGGTAAPNGVSRGFASQARTGGAGVAGGAANNGGWQRFNGTANRSTPGGVGQTGAAQGYAGNRGYSSTPNNVGGNPAGAARSYSAAPRYSAPPSYGGAPQRGYSAPPSSAGRSYSAPSAPRSYGGSSGGGGGRVSGGGGGHSGGGGHGGHR